MSQQNQEIFGHPRGLFYLFFAELWERFSYYGMRALLTLYMVNEFFTYITDEAYREEVSFGIFAAYGSLVYATPVLGGMIADKFIGFKKSIMLGGNTYGTRSFLYGFLF
jgi:POT family proton-dependent oligopeptide transporter